MIQPELLDRLLESLRPLLLGILAALFKQKKRTVLESSCSVFSFGIKQIGINESTEETINKKTHS
jgi:hypothetical protein